MRKRDPEKPLKRGYRIIITILMAVLLTAVSASAVFAGPLVIKDGDSEGDTGGAQQTERDRSIQDGSLIYSMTPVYPEDIKEGTYHVDAVSSSQFFKITDAEITVKDGRIGAVITISSTSYAYVFPGSAQEAAAAGSGSWIPAEESTGYGKFELEAAALNKELPCAAFSKKKEKWYDRDIVFLASSLPEDAVLIELSEDGGTIADTQEAAVKVIYIALGIIIAGGILNHFVKRRFYE